MKISEKLMSIIIIMVFLLGIITAMTLGIWNTSESKEKNIKIQENIEIFVPTDIKGSFTFGEISQIFNIEIKVLYDAFRIPKGIQNQSLEVKNIAPIFESLSFEVGRKSMVAFVSLYNGIPTNIEGIYLPKEAVNIIFERNKNLSLEDRKYLDAHKV